MNHLSAIKVSSLVPPATGKLLIGTHDGSFHCDEALAIAMLTLLPEYHQFDILRMSAPRQQGHTPSRDSEGAFKKGLSYYISIYIQ